MCIKMKLPTAAELRGIFVKTRGELAGSCLDLG